MKKLMVFETLDGVRHDSLERAMHHADKQYGLALTALANDLVRIDKYAAMAEFLDQGMERLKQLERLKLDKWVDEEEGDGHE